MGEKLKRVVLWVWLVCCSISEIFIEFAQPQSRVYFLLGRVSLPRAAHCTYKRGCDVSVPPCDEGVHTSRWFLLSCFICLGVFHKIVCLDRIDCRHISVQRAVVVWTCDIRRLAAFICAGGHQFTCYNLSFMTTFY